MSRSVFVLAAAAALAVATPAPAQHRTYSSGGWVSQYDRPGDYRCDVYWDANDRDCHAGWRDQRRYTSYGYGRHQDPGHGYGYGRGYGRGYGHGHGYTYRQDWRHGPAVYPGAYGRPDLVYPGGGGHYGYAAGRDPRRIDWCRANYRSYDPSSGYYRAYSGRLIFCG